MNEAQTGTPGGRLHPVRAEPYGAAGGHRGRAGAGRGSRDPAAIVSAVAAAIEANDQALPRRLNQMWTSADTLPSAGAEDVASEP